MVNQPEYPNGYPLFTYHSEDGRHLTICLTYPEDGTPPLSLASIRERFAEELGKIRQTSGANVRFYEEYLQALDLLLANRAAGKSMGLLPRHVTTK